MRVVERQFSEFLRQPNDVVAELDDHDVVLRRRNAPSLRLTKAGRDDDRSAAFGALVRLLRNLAEHDRSGFDEAILDVFAWSRFLPSDDRRQFSEDLTQTLMASADFDNYSPVALLLNDWRSTAEIHADPELARRLRAPVEGSGQPVTIPAG